MICKTKSELLRINIFCFATPDKTVTNLHRLNNKLSVNIITCRYWIPYITESGEVGQFGHTYYWTVLISFLVQINHNIHNWLLNTCMSIIYGGMGRENNFIKNVEIQLTQTLYHNARGQEQVVYKSKKPKKILLNCCQW